MRRLINISLHAVFGLVLLVAGASAHSHEVTVAELNINEHTTQLVQELAESTIEEMNATDQTRLVASLNNLMLETTTELAKLNDVNEVEISE